jgi:hypothetical protein
MPAHVSPQLMTRPTPADTRETSCQPRRDADMPVTVDLDALLDGIFEAFRALSRDEWVGLAKILRKRHDWG